MLDEVFPLPDMDEDRVAIVVAVVQNNYHPDVDPVVTLPVIQDGLTDDPQTSSHFEVGQALSTPQQSELKDLLAKFRDVFSDILLNMT